MTYISMNRDVNSSRDQNVRILWRSRWRRSIDWLHAIQQKGRHPHSMCIRHRMYFCPANFIMFIILSIKAVCIKMNKLCAPVYLDICIHGYVYIYHYTWEGTQIQICINVCTHMHIYACTREYSTGLMTNLYGQFTEFYTGISKETSNVYYGIEKKLAR